MEKNIVLDNIISATRPFPHFSSDKILAPELADHLLKWLKTSAQWQLTKTSFYTQYEFSLLDTSLPEELVQLKSSLLIQELYAYFTREFRTGTLALVGITAHKMTDGHRMGVHNDFIGKQETHRLVIQLNEHWNDENGGYLMTFNSSDPKDVATIMKPLHNSGIGFEISGNSYHAVSTVHAFERYTLVYTFSQISL